MEECTEFGNLQRDVALLTLKTEGEGIWAEESGLPLEAGKGKKMDFPQILQKGT